MADEQAEAAEARKMEQQAKKDKAMDNGASEQSAAQDATVENQDVTMENVAQEASTAETSVAKDENDLSELENRDVKKPRAAIVQEEVTHSDTPDVRLRPCEKKKVQTLEFIMCTGEMMDYTAISNTYPWTVCKTRSISEARHTWHP